MRMHRNGGLRFMMATGVAIALTVLWLIISDQAETRKQRAEARERTKEAVEMVVREIRTSAILSDSAAVADRREIIAKQDSILVELRKFTAPRNSRQDARKRGELL